MYLNFLQSTKHGKKYRVGQKFNLQWCLRATLHHDKILEPVVVIAVGVGVHQAASNLFN